MRRPARLLAGTLIFLVFVGAAERAAHYEQARAGGVLSERVEQSGNLDAEMGRYTTRAESTYQGKPVRWWARRAVQARKDANARGRTIRRLKRELARSIVPWYWRAVGSCESGLRWHYNGPSGFDGALQFHPGTWAAYRLPGYPRFAYLASPFQQLVIAELVLARQGWGAWPACSRKVGLR